MRGGSTYDARRRHRTQRQMEQMAEIMASEDCTITAAARRIGVCQQRGSQLWAKIRAGLGSQAQ